MKTFCRSFFVFCVSSIGLSILLNISFNSFLYAQNVRISIVVIPSSDNEECEKKFSTPVEEENSVIDRKSDKFIRTSQLTKRDVEDYRKHFLPKLNLHRNKAIAAYPIAKAEIQRIYDIFDMEMKNARKRSKYSSLEIFKWVFSLMRTLVESKKMVDERIEAELRQNILDSQSSEELETLFKTKIESDLYMNLSIFYNLLGTYLIETLFPTILTCSDKAFITFLDMSSAYAKLFDEMVDIMVPSFSHILNDFYQKNKNHPNYYRLVFIASLSKWINESFLRPIPEVKEKIPDYLSDLITILFPNEDSSIENTNVAEFKPLLQILFKIAGVTFQARELDQDINKVSEERSFNFSKALIEAFAVLDNSSRRLLLWYLSFYTIVFKDHYTKSTIDGLKKFSVLMNDAAIKSKDILCIEQMGYILNSLDMLWDKSLTSATTWEAAAVGFMFYIFNNKKLEDLDRESILNNKKVFFENVESILTYLQTNEYKFLEVDLVDSFISFLVMYTENVEDFITVSSLLYNYGIQKDGMRDCYRRYINAVNINELVSNSTVSKDEIYQKLDKSILETFNVLVKQTSKNTSIKRVYVSLLLNNKTINLEDLYFLIANKKEFNISDSVILEYVVLLSEQELFHFIYDNRHSFFVENRDKIMSKYHDKDYMFSSLEKISSSDHVDFVHMLIFNSDTEIAANLVELLNHNPDLLSAVKKSCSGNVAYHSKLDIVKKFLISKGFLEKTKKAPVVQRAKKEKVVDVSSYVKDKRQVLKNRLIELSLSNNFSAIAEELNKYNLNFYENYKNNKEFLSSINEIFAFLNFVESSTNANINKTYIFNVVPFYYVKFLLEKSLKTKDDSLALSIIRAKLTQNNISKKQLGDLIELVSFAYINSTSNVFRLSVLDLCIDILNNNNLKFDDDTLKEYLRFIIKIGADYPEAFYERIEGLISIIVRFEDKASNLYDHLKYSLMETSSTDGISHSNIVMIEANINLAHLYGTSSSVRKVIIASLLSDFCYLYLYNVGDKDINVLNYTYNDVITLLKKALSYNSSFIRDIAKNTLSSLSSKDLNLEARIERYTLEFDNLRESLSSDDSLELRERLSMYKILLSEIRQGGFALDLSGKEYIGLGYDIFVMNDRSRNIKLIEVKSKVSMSSSYPTYLSRKQLEKAKEIYEDCSYFNKTLEYRVYLVPLKTEEANIYGEIINIDLDLGKMIEVLKNSSENDRSFVLSLFRKND